MRRPAERESPGSHEDRGRRKRSLAARWAFVVEDQFVTLHYDETAKEAQMIRGIGRRG